MAQRLLRSPRFGVASDQQRDSRPAVCGPCGCGLPLVRAGVLSKTVDIEDGAAASHHGARVGGGGGGRCFRKFGDVAATFDSRRP